MKLDTNVIQKFGQAMQSFGDSSVNDIANTVYENYHIDDGSFSLVLDKKLSKDSQIVAQGIKENSSFYGMSIEVLGRLFVVNEDLEILTQIDEENESGEIATGAYYVTDENVIQFIQDYLVMRTNLLEKSNI